MKSAAAFRTFGHLTNAIIVSKFPNIPRIIMIIVAVAAKVSKGRENLQTKKMKLFSISLSDIEEVLTD